MVLTRPKGVGLLEFLLVIVAGTCTDGRLVCLFVFLLVHSLLSLMYWGGLKEVARTRIRMVQELGGDFFGFRKKAGP